MRALRLLALATVAICAFAADITGEWKASMDGPNGAMEIQFTFNKHGDKVTGAAFGPMGKMPLRDVRVDGDKISFTLEAGERGLVHKGQVSGDQMKLNVEMGERSMTMTAKRVTQ
jgi:hypothetical protein